MCKCVFILHAGKSSKRLFDLNTIHTVLDMGRPARGEIDSSSKGGGAGEEAEHP